ncbi:MAG: AraC family transcriptional regulator [Corallococcus sp.]|nr:AraC family transcriptional regulator [Corallococcus sp.]MCM1359924.1 AraC family transcriptional regulator [Corallococcus sp.]MCM1395480.1 AraC family transcriptional regulator [Corallococcus sp.]
MIETNFTEQLHGGIDCTTTLAPFTKYGTDAKDMLPFYPIRWHEETEIIKVQQGKGTVCLDGERHVVEQGDVVVVRSFAMHSVNRIQNTDLVLSAATFNLRTLCENEANDGRLKYFARLLNGHEAASGIIRADDSRNKQLASSVDDVIACNEDCSLSEIKERLRKTFEILFSDKTSKALQQTSRDRQNYTVRLALEYVMDRYASAVSVKQIAERCGYSEFYTMKLFKQFTGYGCVDYVNNYRLYVAGMQLRDTRDGVAAVAKSTGYNNVSYFNRQFKKRYGLTPKEFRKQWTGETK